MKRLSIFVSGNGTNMENIIRSVQQKKIRGAEIAFVFSDNPAAFALTRCKRLKIRAESFSPKDFDDKASYERAILRLLHEAKVDWIILAGYMRLIGETLLGPYRNRILNIHPALLPAFAGRDGIGDALRYGVKVTGVTVHLVDEGVDTGKIILQRALEIRPRDTEATLARRIHQVEYDLYPKAIQMAVEGKIKAKKK